MAALARLRADGWSLSEESAAALLAAECGPSPSLQATLEALLNADLQEVGAAALPDDINRADSKKVAGPLVLQVSAVSDVSQPSRASGDVERKGRILRLRLTDGKGSCVGVEFAPLPYTIEQLCPGTKVRVAGVTARVGVLLLDPRCCEVLGGRVEALAEAWETQQRYGGTATERPAGAGDADKPPSFRPFDPKLAKYGSRRGAAAVAASRAAPMSAAADVGPAAGPPPQPPPQQPPPPQQQQQQQQQPQQPQQPAQQQRPQARRGFQPYQPPPSRQQAQEGAQQQQQQQGRGQGRGRPGEQPQQPRREAQAPAAASPPPVPALQAATGRPVAAVQHSHAPNAAAAKLLGRLQAEEGRCGRGVRKGRHSRHHDDADDDGSMTLEEWEAKQRAAAGAGASTTSTASASAQQQQQLTDEELARQLQRELDLEAAAEWGHPPAQEDLATSLQSMFSYECGPSADEGYGSRGGRGRRGGGGRGRGRGRR